MTDKVTSFVIDRLTWHRGSDGASLLTDQGKRCCLGFFAKACEVSDSEQLNTADPGELNAASKKTLRDAGGDFLFMQDEYCERQSKATDDLVFENDSSDVDAYYGSVREQRITRIFAGNGVTVIFIN